MARPPINDNFSHSGGVSLERAAGGNTELLNVLRGFNADIDDVHVKTGIQRGRAAQMTAAAPAQADWLVTQHDGLYVVDIKVPADRVPKTVVQARRFQADEDGLRRGRGGNFMARAAVLQHQVQTSTNTLFDAAGNVKTYGPDAKIHWEISSPNETRYLRFRSRYSYSDYNGWKYWNTDPAVCGFNPLWAGVVRSLATNLANQATTPSGTNPLTQSGTTTRINAAASLWYAGDLRINYSSGFVDPGSYGTYYVYADDPKKAGGSVTFVATTSNVDITGADGRVYFGKITTTAGGGASGIGGGGGGGCMIGEAEWRMFDGTLKPSWALRKGDQVLAIDGEIDMVCQIKVVPNMPIFSLISKDGTVDHPGFTGQEIFRSEAGQWLRGFDLLPLDRLRRRDADGKPYIYEVCSRPLVGVRTVYYIELHRSKTMIVEGFEQHNKMIP